MTNNTFVCSHAMHFRFLISVMNINILRFPVERKTAYNLFWKRLGPNNWWCIRRFRKFLCVHHNTANPSVYRLTIQFSVFFNRIIFCLISTDLLAWSIAFFFMLFCRCWNEKDVTFRQSLYLAKMFWSK